MSFGNILDQVNGAFGERQAIFDGLLAVAKVKCLSQSSIEHFVVPPNLKKQQMINLSFETDYSVTSSQTNLNRFTHFALEMTRNQSEAQTQIWKRNMEGNAQ